MKVWQGRVMVNQIENFNAFLFRIAYNKSIDFLRSASKDLQFRELLWDQIREAASDSRSDRNILLQEFESKVREAIELLTPQRKKVYELSRQQEMNHDQIASHLQISKSTVNNHIVQAEYFIRSYLSKNLDLATLVLFVVYSPGIS
jgi:RNA polymerase sigma-70 factor (ECF subfamily)